MTEWTNVPDSKSGVGATPPRVRIPLSPPYIIHGDIFKNSIRVLS